MTEHEHANTQPTAGGERPLLSALIRRGGELLDGRQCTGNYIRTDGDEETYCCALGAAYLALTGEEPGTVGDYLSEESPLFGAQDPIDALKAEFPGDGDAIDRIEVWNDAHHMTFEQIAAELEARGL